MLAIQDPGLLRVANLFREQKMAESRIASTSSGSSDGAAAGRGGAARSASLDVGAAAAAQQAIIKCPRCDSLNTKFCYYNNYSRTQPRHFCKSCRRYWTEGGALRNVPVGGGCRKNKRVKQRPLLNLGAAATGLLNPSSLLDDTTSNMLARLSSSAPFPNFSSGASSFCSSEDNSSHLLNIAFSRFQESLRLRQQQQQQCSDGSPEIAPYFDMSFPALVHKQSTPPLSCSLGACGSRLHHGLCSGLINPGFEGNLGFSSDLQKMDHGVAMAGFCNTGYELNPMYHDQSPNMHMVGTSATATLASIEDQLSSFSNLQHVDAFNADTSTALAEQKCGGGAMEGMKRDMMSAGPQLQALLGHVENAGETTVGSVVFTDETKERLMHDMDEKPLLSKYNSNHELTLMMQHAPTVDGINWQTNEMLMEPHHSNNIWSGHAPRWQDALAATPAAAAGGVL